MNMYDQVHIRSGICICKHLLQLRLFRRERLRLFFLPPERSRERRRSSPRAGDLSGRRHRPDRTACGTGWVLSA